MGTNYYWHPIPKCEHCGREYPSIHIGKSSGGWCFSLHVFEKYEVHEDIEKYVAHDVEDLGDWKELFNYRGHIMNEYDEKISVAEMLEIITDRKEGTNFDEVDWRAMRYSSEEDFHRDNYSERGPRNLLRHSMKRDSGCVGHGAGTWDYIKGDFS